MTVCVVVVVVRLSSVGMEDETSMGVAMSSSFVVLTVANAALRYLHVISPFLFFSLNLIIAFVFIVILLCFNWICNYRETKK